MLPKELHDMVAGEHFLEDCETQFAELDLNSDGVLTPDELCVGGIVGGGGGGACPAPTTDDEGHRP